MSNINMDDKSNVQIEQSEILLLQQQLHVAQDELQKMQSILHNMELEDGVISTEKQNIQDAIIAQEAKIHDLRTKLNVDLDDAIVTHSVNQQANSEKLEAGAVEHKDSQPTETQAEVVENTRMDEPEKTGFFHGVRNGIINLLHKIGDSSKLQSQSQGIQLSQQQNTQEIDAVTPGGKELETLSLDTVGLEQVDDLLPGVDLKESNDTNMLERIRHGVSQALQLHEYREKVCALQQQIRDVQDEKHELAHNISLLQKQLDEKAAELETKQNSSVIGSVDVKSVSEQMTQLLTEIQTLKESNLEKDKYIQECETQLTDMRENYEQKMQHYEAQNDQLVAQLDCASYEAQDADKRIDLLQTRANEMASEYKQTLDAQQQLIECLRDEKDIDDNPAMLENVQLLQRELATYKHEMKLLDNTVHQLNGEITRYQNEIQGYQQSEMQLKRDLEQKDIEIQDLCSKVQVLDSRESDKIAELEKQLQENHANLYNANGVNQSEKLVECNRLKLRVETQQHYLIVHNIVHVVLVLCCIMLWLYKNRAIRTATSITPNMFKQKNGGSVKVYDKKKNNKVQTRITTTMQ